MTHVFQVGAQEEEPTDFSDVDIAGLSFLSGLRVALDYPPVYLRMEPPQKVDRLSKALEYLKEVVKKTSPSSNKKSKVAVPDTAFDSVKDLVDATKSFVPKISPRYKQVLLTYLRELLDKVRKYAEKLKRIYSPENQAMLKLFD